MIRPDVDAILEPLTPFQRRTVEHAFRRLFLAEDSTARFLVADEVGLGKTLVARGVIARTIDHLWEDVGRIDVVYICSNGSIARSNLPKLQIGEAEQRSFALATRLTMLATKFASEDGRSGLDGVKLNFVSFTPGTSFNMGHSAGQQHEREVLFQLLSSLCPSRRRTALMNLLQGWIARKDRWRWRLQNEACPIEPTIRECFVAAFREQADLQGELRTLFDTWFFRYRQSWPHEAQHRRDRAISQLRRLLADVCVHALEPDLVIVDEFQVVARVPGGSPGSRRRAGSEAVQCQGARRAEGADTSPLRNAIQALHRRCRDRARRSLRRLSGYVTVSAGGR